MQDATGPDEIIEASPPILVNQPHSLAIVKAAADVVWIVSARGDRIVDASGWRELTGQTDEEMQHGGWMRAVHPDDRRRTLRAWIGAVGRSASVEIEHRIRRRDGAYRTMRLRAIPVSDDRGQLREWVGMHTDETEQIAVRESLLASGESFRKLAEDLPQLVWTADANGAKTYCNQRYLNYTGALSVDEIDRSWLTYVHPDDRASAAHAWQRSLATGEPYECEYRFRRFDGSYRAFLARATAARDHQGRIVGWVGSGTDVHERKQLEAAMRKSEKLAIAGRLAANISHELNNPLAAALNTLYLALQDQNLSESSRMYVKLAEGQLKRIARLTRQTLRFHRQSSEPVLADLCAIMDSVLDAAAPENTPGVAAERQYHDSSKLYCFAEDVRQAFASVIGNALDALAGNGRLVIRIHRARRHDKDECGTRVVVADSGPGISAHLLADVCEPFTTTKSATGTGLGLWVTRGIMERHGGLLRIRSSTDTRRHGTTVTLFFPYAGVVGES